MTDISGERTVGVEEELLLVDPATGCPRPLGDDVVEAAGGSDTGPGGVEHELKREQVELGTDPVDDLSAVDASLRRLRGRLAAAAERHGLRLAALATSPVEVAPTATRDARYERLNREYGMTARELLCNGCHVHVAVESLDEAVGVIDRVRPWLAVLTALSTNSPYWQGRDTGYASYRQRLWSRWPSAGPSELFGTAAGYRAAVDTMVACGGAMDHGMVYLDVRASREWPTVEVRVLDVCLDVEDAVMLTGLARALVETAARDWQRSVPATPLRIEVLRAAAWRAARTGLGGDLVDPVAGTTVPARIQVQRLLDHARPALRRYGDEQRVSDRVEEVLANGTGADVQRAAYAQRSCLVDVVTDAVRRTVSGSSLDRAPR